MLTFDHPGLDRGSFGCQKVGPSGDHKENHERIALTSLLGLEYSGTQCRPDLLGNQGHTGSLKK